MLRALLPRVLWQHSDSTNQHGATLKLLSQCCAIELKSEKAKNRPSNMQSSQIGLINVSKVVDSWVIQPQFSRRFLIRAHHRVCKSKKAGLLCKDFDPMWLLHLFENRRSPRIDEQLRTNSDHEEAEPDKDAVRQATLPSTEAISSTCRLQTDPTRLEKLCL